MADLTKLMNATLGPVHMVKALDVPLDRFDGVFANNWSETHTECGEPTGFMRPTDTTMLHQRVTCLKCLNKLKVKPRPKRVGRLG